MAVLQIVLEIIIPVFGVLGLGYAVSKFGWFDESAERGLSIYVFRIAIPLMLFRSMALVELPGYFPIGFIASYFIAAYSMFIAGLLLARRLFGFNLAKQGLFGFGCGYSNLVLIGIPLVLTVWGERAVLPLFSIVAVHTVLMFTPLTAILEINRGDTTSIPKIVVAAVSGVARNQYIIGVMMGLVYNLLGLPLPGSIDSMLSLIADSATPGALFCMGASLSRYRIVGEVPAAITITILKGVVFPAVVWMLGSAFGIDELWVAVAVVIAAMPTGINIYLYAQQYQSGVPLATTVTVVSTATSVFTVTIVLTLLGVR